jgi:Ca2+-binding EF-hand superfamily protein
MIFIPPVIVRSTSIVVQLINANCMWAVDQKELKDLYKQFKKEIPSGGINKRDFKELLKGLGVVDVFLQDLIFNTFDYDKDGQINFKDVTTGLSIIARGDPDEKLEREYLLN